MLRKSLLLVLLTALMLSVAATVAVGQQVACPPPQQYHDPTWVGEIPWDFSACTGPKAWAQWACSAPGAPDEWGYTNYPAPLGGEPALFWTPWSLTVTMPNQSNPDLYKQVWMQFEVERILCLPTPLQPTTASLKWDRQNVPLVLVSDKVGPRAGAGSERGDNMELIPGGSEKYLVTAYWEIWPQPDCETFCWVWQCDNVKVSDIKMATQCIPEPVFFQMGALLGLSGIGLLRARKR